MSFCVEKQRSKCGLTGLNSPLILLTMTISCIWCDFCLVYYEAIINYLHSNHLGKPTSPQKSAWNMGDLLASGLFKEYLEVNVLTK